MVEIIESIGIFLGFIGLGLAIADKFKKIEDKFDKQVNILKKNQIDLSGHILLHCKALCRIDTELEKISPNYNFIGDLKPDCKIIEFED